MAFFVPYDSRTNQGMFGSYLAGVRARKADDWLEKKNQLAYADNNIRLAQNQLNYDTAAQTQPLTIGATNAKNQYLATEANRGNAAAASGARIDQRFYNPSDEEAAAQTKRLQALGGSAAASLADPATFGGNKDNATKYLQGKGYLLPNQEINYENGQAYVSTTDGEGNTVHQPASAVFNRTAADPKVLLQQQKDAAAFERTKYAQDQANQRAKVAAEAQKYRVDTTETGRSERMDKRSEQRIKEIQTRYGLSYENASKLIKERADLLPQRGETARYTPAQKAQVQLATKVAQARINALDPPDETDEADVARYQNAVEEITRDMNGTLEKVGGAVAPTTAAAPQAAAPATQTDDPDAQPSNTVGDDDDTGADVSIDNASDTEPQASAATRDTRGGQSWLSTLNPIGTAYADVPKGYRQPPQPPQPPQQQGGYINAFMNGSLANAAPVPPVQRGGVPSSAAPAAAPPPYVPPVSQGFAPADAGAGQTPIFVPSEATHPLQRSDTNERVIGVYDGRNPDLTGNGVYSAYGDNGLTSPMPVRQPPAPLGYDTVSDYNYAHAQQTGARAEAQAARRYNERNDPVKDADIANAQQRYNNNYPQALALSEATGAPLWRTTLQTAPRMNSLTNLEVVQLARSVLENGGTMEQLKEARPDIAAQMDKLRAMATANPAAFTQNAGNSIWHQRAN